MEMKSKTNEKIKQEWNYAVWRLEVWLAGYGSYREIERDLDKGIITIDMTPEEYMERKNKNESYSKDSYA